MMPSGRALCHFGRRVADERPHELWILNFSLSIIWVIAQDSYLPYIYSYSVSMV